MIVRKADGVDLIFKNRKESIQNSINFYAYFPFQELSSKESQSEKCESHTEEGKFDYQKNCFPHVKAIQNKL